MKGGIRAGLEGGNFAHFYKCSEWPLILNSTESSKIQRKSFILYGLFRPQLSHLDYELTAHLDAALVPQPGDVPGLAGELTLHSLGDLKLCGGVENCRCKA